MIANNPATSVNKLTFICGDNDNDDNEDDNMMIESVSGGKAVDEDETLLMDLDERVSADSSRNSAVKRSQRMPAERQGGFSARAAALIEARN